MYIINTSLYLKKKTYFSFSFFRLCSLTITRLSLLASLPADLSSLSLAVKMQSSKRTLRSHEILVPQSVLSSAPSGGMGAGVGGGIGSIATTNTTNNTFGSIGGGTGVGIGGNIIGGTGGGVGSLGTGGGIGVPNNAPLLERELDLHFSLQYPHFIKRDGNRFVYT